MEQAIIQVEQLQKRIAKKREQDEICPIPKNLRDDLIQLKTVAMGNLKQQIRTIKDMKYAEFKSKYHDKATLEYNKRTDKARKFVDKAKELAQKVVDLKSEMPEHVNFNEYNAKDALDVFNLNTYRLKEEILKDMFDEWATKFNIAYEKIGQYETLFDEAVMFGDLELVKDIYFKLKQADSIVNKLNEVKV